MPKQETNLPVARFTNDPNGGRIFVWYYNACGKSVELEQKTGELNDDDNYVKQGYYLGIQSSRLEAIHLELKTLIQKEDIGGLKNLLQTNFIYPEKIFSLSQHIHYNNKKTNNIKHEVHYTRPNIEALFFDNNAYFLSIINLLLEMNKESLFQAFSDSLQNTDLPAEKLFAWDEAVKSQLLNRIENLSAYGQKLKLEGGKSKGLCINEITTELRPAIQDKAVLNPNEKVNLSDQFNLLKFKLDIMQKLYSKDDILGKHRGYKRVVANIFSILFTLGIANLIRKQITNVGFFFNNTTTKEKISTIQATVVGSKEEINFNI